MLKLKSKFFSRFLPLTLAFFGLLVIAGVYFILKSDKPAEAAWYNSSWTYRKPITIDKNKVATSTALTNFPVLISVTDTDLKYTSFGGKVGKTDGTDILFTSSDGSTKLYHEIEKYSSSTGETIMWVQVPSLSGANDTTLYIYFGNSGASDQQAVTSTWDSNYKLVWHMAQYWDDNAEDSTSNNNDGVNANQISSDQATGKIGGTVKFRGGGGAYYTVTDHASLNSTTNITVSMWYRRAEPSTSWPYMWENGTSGNYWMLSKTNAHKFDFTISGVANNPSNVDVDYGQWHYLTAVKSGDSGTNLSIYVDGVLDKTFSIGSIGAQTGNKRMIVGDSIDTWIDEFRISDSARTAGWIKTEYNNQFDPGSFYAYGSLSIQTVSTLPAASATGVSWYNSSWGYRRQITIDKNKVASSSLSNFPMLFSVTDLELKYTSHGGKVGKTDGTDILFTSSNGTTKIDHEIEKYSSSTGETIIWVEVPTLSGTSDTTIYMYFGNSGASDQQAATSTWDSSYTWIQHLQGTTDSTSNARNLSVLAGSPTASTGKIGGAYTYDGNDSHYNNTDFLQYFSVSTATIQAWVKQTGTPPTTAPSLWAGDPIVANLDGYIGLGSWNSSGNKFGALNYDGNGDYAHATSTNNEWTHAVLVHTGGNVYYYQDGELMGSAASGNTTDPVSNSYMLIGGNLYSTQYFVGSIDEARISNVARSASWIKTEYNNQSDPGSFYAYGALQSYTRSGAGVKAVAAASGGGSWYNSSWTYRKQITVDKNKVATSSSLSNFPMLFSVTDSELKHTSHGGRVGKTDGTDILFTSSDGTTKLSHEIEKYASSTGETVIWVKVPTLSGTSDTVLYMYYGNSGASDQQLATSTWDSNYQAVYHLPNGTTLSTNDSTSNARNGTPSGTPQSITGVVDGAVRFTAANKEAITTTYATDLTQWTVSFWVKSPAAPGASANIGVVHRDSNYGFTWDHTDSTFRGTFAVEATVNSWQGATVGTLNPNTWYYLVGSYTSGSLKAYNNGMLTGNNTSPSGNPVSEATSVAIGKRSNNATTSYFNGDVDEVRISNSVRLLDWISTEYNNQSDPASFYAYGATQTQNKSGAGGTGSAPAVKVRGQVKFR